MKTDWTVHEHTQPISLAPSLWWLDGTLPRSGLRRVCTLARMATGDVVVHSAICMDEAGMAALAGIGPVRWIIVPNRMHRTDAPRFAARFPEARVLCPAGAREKVAEVVRVDGTLADFPDDPVVSFLPLDGVGDQEWVMRVQDPGETALVFTDVLFNLPHQGGLGGLIMRALGSSGGPRVTRVARMMMVKDRGALRRRLEALAETSDLRRLVPGHGEVVDTDAATVLRQVAAGL